MSLQVNNITNKAVAIVEDYKASDVYDEWTIEEYLNDCYDNDSDFIYWLLDYNEGADELSCFEADALVSDLLRECQYLK